jgi:hypothetical protein
MMEGLSEESKLWLYQCNRNLSDSEKEEISEKLRQFCKEWTAHNLQLKADFEIIDNRIIALVVDESMNDASGCSIDKSVNRLKSIGAELNIDFFNRTNMLFKINNQIESIDFKEVAEKYSNGEINKNSMIYNMNLSLFGELKTQFLIPFEAHWLFQKTIRHQNG